MDLVADVGNTRTHLALVEGRRVAATAAVAHAAGDAAATEGWEAILAEGPAPERAALVHVQPAAAEAFAAWTRRRLGLEARVLGEDLPHGLPLQVDAPEQVGPDRIANALWAARTHPGCAAVVADLGTAITFDAVSAAGAFRGGAIAPGLRAGAWALSARTARLPEVAPEASPRALGRTTPGCIAAGLYWGAVGLIETVTERIGAELGEAPLVVATGGDAALVAPACPSVTRVVPHVTLLGVALALEAGG